MLRYTIGYKVCATGLIDSSALESPFPCGTRAFCARVHRKMVTRGAGYVQQPLAKLVSFAPTCSLVPVVTEILARLQRVQHECQSELSSLDERLTALQNGKLKATAPSATVPPATVPPRAELANTRPTPPITKQYSHPPATGPAATSRPYVAATTYASPATPHPSWPHTQTPVPAYMQQPARPGDAHSSMHAYGTHYQV